MVTLDPPELDDAIRYYQASLALRKNSAGVHVHLGYALHQRKRLDEAIVCFNKAIELRPQGPAAYKYLGDLLMWEMGKVTEAVTCYEKAIDLRPDYFDAYLNLGATFADMDELDKAIACYQRAVELKPEDHRPHSNLGSALGRKGQLEGAFAAIKKSLEIRASADAYANLATAYNVSGRPEQADDCLRQAIKLNPHHAHANHMLGNSLSRQGQLEEAIACYKKAVAVKPRDVAALNDLGIALSASGRPDEAIAVFRTATKISPRHAKSHNNLGTALVRNGRLEEALLSYREAIRMNEAYAEPHSGLGDVHQRKGQFEEALKWFRAAQKLGRARKDWDHVKATASVKRCEELSAMERRLPEVVDNSTSATELMSYATFCQVRKRMSATAARLYQKAFLAEPGSASTAKRPRLDAAYVAILAGLGSGEDAVRLSDDEKAAWRQQARTWIRSELEEWTENLEQLPPSKLLDATKRLWRWETGMDLAGVCEKTRLLPDSEQKEWNSIWSDLKGILGRSACLFNQTTLTGSLGASRRESILAVTMNVGKCYVIEMESKDFDCYLELKGADGKVLRQDDDSGGGTNAQIVFFPEATAVYQIAMTSFARRGSGPYTLIVRAFEAAK